MFKEEIFKAYDIRGKYGKDFDKEFAGKLGGVLVKHLGAKKVVVARDMRESSDELAEAVIDGTTTMGADVIDIGKTSTPLFYFGVINEGADGGIMITASHLGEEFNGFKVTKEEAIPIGGTELLENVGELLRKDTSPLGHKGNVVKKNLLSEYADFSVKNSGVRKGEITTRVKLVGVEMVLNEVRAALDKLSVPVVSQDEEIGFEFDGDGDRVSILSASGKRIRGDLTGGLLAGYYFAGRKVVYDLRYSRGVLEYLKSKDVEAIPSRIGHKLIKELMRKRDAEFCGEQSGHFYFKSVGYVESSILAILKVLEILAKTGASIDELINTVSNWSTTEEIYFDLGSFGDIKNTLSGLREKYGDGQVDETDGIRVEYPNWGFLLRPSNTEAKIKLIVDAREEALMNEKKEELLELLAMSKS